MACAKPQLRSDRHPRIRLLIGKCGSYLPLLRRKPRTRVPLIDLLTRYMIITVMS